MLFLPIALRNAHDIFRQNLDGSKLLVPEEYQTRIKGPLLHSKRLVEVTPSGEGASIRSLGQGRDYVHITIKVIRQVVVVCDSMNYDRAHADGHPEASCHKRLGSAILSGVQGASVVASRGVLDRYPQLRSMDSSRAIIIIRGSRTVEIPVATVSP